MASFAVWRFILSVTTVCRALEVDQATIFKRLSALGKIHREGKRVSYEKFPLIKYGFILINKGKKYSSIASVHHLLKKGFNT